MHARTIWVALFSVSGLAAQDATSPVPGDRIPARVRATIDRELGLISSAEADWTLRRSAVASLVALAGNPKKSGFVVHMVSSAYLRSATSDTAHLLLSALGHIPANRREQVCEKVIARVIDEEARLRKASKTHVVSVKLLQRLDVLLGYCTRENAFAVRNRIMLEPWGAAGLTLHVGVFGLLRAFSPAPYDLAMAKRIAVVVSGTKPEIREKVDAYISARTRKAIPAGLARRIDRAMNSFSEPPDILQQYALWVDHVDLSFTCPIMTAWDLIQKKTGSVPRVDSDPAALCALLSGPLLDKYDSDLRGTVLALIGSRPDVVEFLPALCDAFEREGYPPIYRHEKRPSAAAADHLVHLAAARAMQFAVSTASAGKRAPFRARYNEALAYLGQHGTPSERRNASVLLGVGKTKK